MWLDANNNLITIEAIADQSAVRDVPTTGFSYTVPNQVNIVVLDPAGTLATGTVVLPAAPIDRQTVRVASSQIITALTVSPSAGQTLKGAPTTLAANTSVAWIYFSATSTWYRLQ
jgi:hypothetical protein